MTLARAAAASLGAATAAGAAGAAPKAGSRPRGCISASCARPAPQQLRGGCSLVEPRPQGLLRAGCGAKGHRRVAPGVVSCQRVTAASSSSSEAATPAVARRAALAFSAAVLALPTVPAAVAETLTEPKGPLALYENSTEGYSLLVPKEWEKGEGKTGTRTVTAFFPHGDTETNVNIVVTFLGADYTNMGSFGSPFAFGESLVNSLDRSWKRPPGQKARLIDARLLNGTVERLTLFCRVYPGDPRKNKRHLLAVVGMNSNGWVNRLLTVTGQYREEDAGKFSDLFEKISSSFSVKDFGPSNGAEGV
eukprot:SM000036S13287  [mRNA]  locus=s36:427857:430358:+ [translate_table: standard]